MLYVERVGEVSKTKNGGLYRNITLSETYPKSSKYPIKRSSKRVKVPQFNLSRHEINSFLFDAAVGEEVYGCIVELDTLPYTIKNRIVDKITLFVPCEEQDSEFEEELTYLLDERERQIRKHVPRFELVRKTSAFAINESIPEDMDEAIFEALAIGE